MNLIEDDTRFITIFYLEYFGKNVLFELGKVDSFIATYELFW